MPTLAALVTVYHRIDPAELRACLASLAAQTRPADEVVIVADGPLSPPLDAVLSEFAAQHPEGRGRARIVRCEQNRGAGPAAAAGMAVIDAEWVARLDADDVAKPERFERQLAYLAEHPGVDTLGTAVAEFDGTDFDHARTARVLPAAHPDIVRYAKMNSPVNNPTVMLRRTAVERAGGYRDVHHMEDYDLYARLIASGARLHNLPEPLTYFRVNPDQFGRRTGRGMLRAECQMQRNLVKYGLISWPRAGFNVVARSVYRALPQRILQRVYRMLFRP